MAIPELKDSKDRLTDCIYFGDPLSASVGSGFVPTNRTLATTAPLQGGGDLSANRTFTIDEFAGSVPGSVPTSAGNTDEFLRGDGGWEVPPTFTDTDPGYAPASGGGTTNFLRADGTWDAPAGAVIAGLTVGRFPIATAADAIGNSRAIQTGTTFEWRTTETNAATDYHGLRLNETGGYLELTPYFYNPPTTFATSLVMRAQDAIGFFEATGDSYLKLNGQVCLPEDVITLANGLNSDIALPTAVTSSWIRSIGPTAAFSVGGFANPQNGQVVVLYNTTQQPMTIVNEDASSAAVNRILTLNNTNATLPANTSSATFIYSQSDLHWILVATNPPQQYPRTSGYIPYQNAYGNLADATLYYNSAANLYGFANSNPKTTVDINGSLAIRYSTMALSNGLNSNVFCPTTSYVRVTGPTASFSLGGISPVSNEDGKRLTIRNATAFTMTIVHEDVSSTSIYRILTPNGTNITLGAVRPSVELVYDKVQLRWIVTNVEPAGVAGSTGYVQFNSAGAPGADAGLVVSGTGTGLGVTLGTDVVFVRKAQRHLQFGASGPATNEYFITGQSSIGGTDSNKRGGDLSVGGGAGTGTKGGGDTILVTAYPGVSGNTQNSWSERLIHAAKPVTLVDSSATQVFIVDVPSEGGSGGILIYTIYATDGTDMQILRGSVPWGAVNKAGTITPVLGTPVEVDCTPTGTLTVTVTAVDAGSNALSFKLNAVSSLTTTEFVAWISMQHDGKGAITTI